MMTEMQILFRLEKDLLDALDRSLPGQGFKTRNEWFRAQVRRAVEDSKRRRVAGILDRLTIDGAREEDIVEMVREWRTKKGRR
jgi:metal-responsive CopG/Arc/MetJ family transcriptional regulator